MSTRPRNARRAPHRLVHRDRSGSDGSADASGRVCRESARRHPGLVTFIDLARNAGGHNAVIERIKGPALPIGWPSLVERR